MLRITYDHQIFDWQRVGGISRYYYELAKRVAWAEGFTASVAAPLYVNSYLSLGGVKVNGLNVSRTRRLGRGIRAVNRLLGPLTIRALRPDIVHETYYHERSFAPKKCPSVVTVYDMIHEKFPDNFPKLDRTSASKRAAVNRADHVICISENTRKDLIDIFGVSPGKARTIRLGFSLTETAADEPPPIPQPYLLYVGNRDLAYKNFQALLTAYAASPTANHSVDLIAFGGGPFSNGEHDLIRSFGLGARVRQMSGDDAVLASLYKGAAAFVFPSLYEGFGIPPLEAMSFNCPVICSNASSIPEVVGDAALLFDPADTASISKTIEAVIGSVELRQQLVRRGKERLGHFSWDQCAMETMQTYRELKR